MVKIISTKNSLNKKGEPFVSLKLQGDPEFVQSTETGKMYLTAKTCYVTSTFKESEAIALIGKELPGTVERIPCKPYEYKVESTGESITLMHTFEYKPQVQSVPDSVIEETIVKQYDEFAELRALGYKAHA